MAIFCFKPAWVKATLVPPLKHRKLDVPFRVQCEKRQEARLVVMSEAQRDLEKVIKSKKTQFVGGTQGLQCRRA
jgi:hypothetical protein